jgi:hypothetical protein
VPGKKLPWQSERRWRNSRDEKRPLSAAKTAAQPKLLRQKLPLLQLVKPVPLKEELACLHQHRQ